jgi:hypothetical protein
VIQCFADRDFFRALARLDDAGGELPGDSGGLVPAPDEQHLIITQHDSDGDPQGLGAADQAGWLACGEFPNRTLTAGLALSSSSSSAS